MSTSQKKLKKFILAQIFTIIKMKKFILSKQLAF